jgi:hypothetical protein
MGNSSARTQGIDKDILVPSCKRPHAETKTFIQRGDRRGHLHCFNAGLSHMTYRILFVAR